MPKYRVLSVDVWGNSVDGYDTNEIIPTGRTIELPEGADRDDVRRALKRDGWVPGNLANAKIGADDQGEWYGKNCGSWWITDERTPRQRGKPEDNAEGYGRPLYELKLIETEIDTGPEPTFNGDAPTVEIDDTNRPGSYVPDEIDEEIAASHDRDAERERMLAEDAEDRDREDALEEYTREKIERERAEVYDHNHEEDRYDAMVKVRGSLAFRRVARRATRKGFTRPILRDNVGRRGAAEIMISRVGSVGGPVLIPCTVATAARRLRDWLKVA